MRALLLTAAVGVAMLLVGCEKPQFKAIAQLPPPAFGDEVRQEDGIRNDADRIRREQEEQLRREQLARAAVQPVPQQQAQQQPAVVRAFDPAWEDHAADNGWKYIIIHHSASNNGNAAIFDRDHRVNRGWDELGYHFVIGNGTNSRDGLVEIGPRWVKQKHGAHCKTRDEQYNNFGIGICLVGNFDHSSPTAAQMASLQKLVTYLAQKYNIPTQNILGHREAVAQVHEGGTDCPGRYFNMAAFRQMISRWAFNN